MIKVAVVGLGYMGKGIVNYILNKKKLKLVGMVDKCRKKPWRKLLRIKIFNNINDLLYQEKPDVIILATTSFIKNLFSDIELILNNKINCICIGEEMSYPYCANKKLSNKLHQLAIRNKVTLLGTGINPGFVLDTLIVALSGVCSRIDYIEASRINDLSPFGPTVMKSQGVGTSPEEFKKGIADNSIVGHIGFKQSINLIAQGLNWKIDRIEQTCEPIISNVIRSTPCIRVKPGYVAGCKQTAIGYIKCKKVIRLIHPQQIKPEKEKIVTGDYIKIKGEPNLSVSIKPEIPGGKGTIAIAVNCIEPVFYAEPGFKTMLDMKYISCKN